jgi:hypothetical protein
VPLNIEGVWGTPVQLRVAASGAIYECPDLDSIPASPGIYIFYRKHGERVSPLYIGRSRNIRNRIKQHLNSVKLMQAIYEAQSGSRFVIYCEPITKPGQDLDKVLRLLENALIDHAMSEGHDLRQKQGTKPAHHTISFRGNRTSEAIAGRLMRVRV